MNQRTNLEILDDVDRLAQLQAYIKDATSEADSIKARLRADYADNHGTHDVGTYRLSVTTSTRFSEDKARAALPADLIEACTVSKLDATLVKKSVAPLVYEALCDESTPRVAVA